MKTWEEFKQDIEDYKEGYIPKNYFIKLYDSIYSFISDLYYKVHYFIERVTGGTDYPDGWAPSIYAGKLILRLLPAYKLNNDCIENLKPGYEHPCPNDYKNGENDEQYEKDCAEAYYTTEEWHNVLDNIAFFLKHWTEYDVVYETEDGEMDLMDHPQYIRGRKLYQQHIFDLTGW